jgi:NAD(P)-dependent dehydrogenase (short-subunit alcohol dehydrogenase family)
VEGSNPTALIFGSSGGLGKALADRYRQKGYVVLAVSRKECDFSDTHSVKAFLDRTIQEKRKISVCLFTAGLSHAGWISDLPAEAYVESFHVGFFSPVKITLDLQRSGLCSRFVFILSGAGDFLMPGLSPYALSKRALRDFLYIAGMEGSLSNVSLIKIWPGPMDTDFNRKTRVYGGFRIPRNRRPRSAEEIARKIFQVEQKGGKRLVVSYLPILLGRLQSVFGGLFAFLSRRWSAFER